MEANFSLHSIKQQLAFFKKVLEKRLGGIFKFDNDFFLQIIKTLLGEEYLLYEFRYRTNMDIISMLVVWVAKACVLDHSLCGLTSLMARVVVGRGLQCPYGEGIMPNSNDVEFKPFLLWRDGANQEARIEEAQLGWENLKDYIREKEVELQKAKEAKKDVAKRTNFAPEDY